MNTTPLKVSVFGGTGYYGQYIINSLLSRNTNVTVVSRSADKLKALFGSNVRGIQGDVRDKNVIKLACQGQDVIIIALSAMTWKLIKDQRAIERDAVLEILEQANLSACSRVLYLSGYEMRIDVLKELNILPFGSIKIEIESTLAKSELNYTIIGCAPAFQLFFALHKNGAITIPGGGNCPFPTVAAEDVGAIVAQSVDRKDLKGKRLRLTGERAYNIPEVANLIQQITGCKTGVREVPLQAVRIVSALIRPFNPYLRELYMSLKMLNNFPKDLSDRVPEDHQNLQNLFDYKTKTLEAEIKERWTSGNL